MSGSRARVDPRIGAVVLGIVCIVCVALMLGAAWAMHQRRAAQQQRERGGALFHGERPIVARLRGHEQPLPMAAVRCINCHETLTRAPSTAGRASSADLSLRPYASMIRGEALTTLHRRRGGPPSVYDEAGLCALLRTGVDPAHVMIPGTMPRYDLTDDECAALWAYLRHDKP